MSRGETLAFIAIVAAMTLAQLEPSITHMAPQGVGQPLI